MPTDNAHQWDLAIDFGTTYTTAAIAAGGKVEVVEVDGSPRVPSIVLATDSGDLMVGRAAEGQVALAPECAERTPKRRLGDDLMLLGGRPVRPVDAVAAVLRLVADEAWRRRGGQAPRSVRLTHPASWADARLDALREAARLAGLGDPELVPEPVAAAIQFADERIASGAYVAVYDLGGGTFDTAVLRRTDTSFEVVGAPGGNDRLGGEDFDERLYHHLGTRIAAELPEAWEALCSSPERAWRRANYDFRCDVRRAKEALSSNPDYTLYLGAPVDLELHVTREEFEGLIRADIEGTVDELVATLAGSGIAPGELAAVNLVGGSSRIPLITKLVAARFGRVPDTWGDPKAVVALGAARGSWRNAPALADTDGGGGADAAAPTKEPVALSRDRLGPYELIAELGRGGMGVVYLARQPSVNRLVAVKTLPAFGENLAARLEREAEVLAGLQHPHLATVLDVGEVDSSVYVVMPYFAGGTLSHIMAKEGRLTAGQAAGVLAAMAEALDATHKKGFLHRDVKPSNILLSEQGEAYLADFGLALPLESSRLTSSKAVLGTIGYTAPEVIADERPTAACDTYALGICGYQMLSGQLPYQGSHVFAVMDAARRGEAVSLAELAPHAPAALVELVTAAMAVDPTARPHDLRAYAAAIRAAVPTESLSPAPPPNWSEAVATSRTRREATRHERQAYVPPSPEEAGLPRRPRRTRALAALATAVVVVVALVAAAVGLSTGGSEASSSTTAGLAATDGGDGEVALEPETGTLQGGVELTRTWTLGGTEGDRFEGELVFSNPSDEERKVVHTEVIPKELASDVDDIDFSREPTKVIESDPIVQWTLTLEPEETFEIAYRIDVEAEGATEERLEGWQEQRDEALTAYQRSTTTTTAAALAAVPEVKIGGTTAEAEAALKTAGFVVGEITSVENHYEEANQVIGTVPAAGTELAEGSEVTVVISSGPGPAAPPSSPGTGTGSGSGSGSGSGTGSGTPPPTSPPTTAPPQVTTSTTAPLPTAPVANNDWFTEAEGYDYYYIYVLGNDTGSGISISGCQNPSDLGYEAGCDSTTLYYYDSTPGTDYVDYTITDGYGRTSSATVTICLTGYYSDGSYEDCA